MTVDPSKVYRGVRGWEEPGRGVGGKSGSSLVLREPSGEVACVECVTRLKLGFNANQESLV